MRNKQMKWPKWTEDYQELEDHNDQARNRTATDRFWNPVEDFLSGLMAAIRHLAGTFGKVIN